MYINECRIVSEGLIKMQKTKKNETEIETSFR